MFHLLQPLLGAPFFDGSLKIFLAEDTILHMKDLGVLPHLFTTRNCPWGNLGKPWHLGVLKVFLAETYRERKHTKSRDTVPGRSGKIYSKNFCNRRKVSSQSGAGGGVRGTVEGARRGQEGGAPGGLLGPLELLSGT